MPYDANSTARGGLLRSLALAACLALSATAAQAHSFTVALLAAGPDRAQQLEMATQGFLLATAERDGHPDETADGHLGGLDSHILPLPRADAGQVRGLYGGASDQPDIVVLLGDAQAQSGDAVQLIPGTLPADWADATDPQGFAARHLAVYGIPPGPTAAAAYNAARRIDLAVRRSGGVDDRAALAAALAQSAAGIDW